MKAKLKIQNARKVLAQFSKEAKKGDSGNVIVGYTAEYAMPVHEMENANFKRPGATSKFLEGPFRKGKDKWVAIAVTAYNGGATLQQGLFISGLALQRDSQKVCPVDTGHLRASAFTRKE